MLPLARNLRVSAVARISSCRQIWLYQRRGIVIKDWPEKGRTERDPLIIQGWDETDDLGNRDPAIHTKLENKKKGLSALRALREDRKHVNRLNFGPDTWRRLFKESTDIPTRTRFAPSPTGYLHLGSLRTALFNCMIKLANPESAFVIRLEDTDQSRLVSDAEEKIYKDLSWAGLEWDEGPDKGGPYGPYKQSERLPIYREHVDQLLENGHAYRCFCSQQQLEDQKRRQVDAGEPVQYDGTCRSIPADESANRAANSEPHVVRFKGYEFGSPNFKDGVHGSFKKKDHEEDFIIMKTDGFPTYHLANVVDDHLMKITHVIRGEEWLISTPKHLALYQAFRWKPPTFAHLGLLVAKDGLKLSKRDASVTLEEYQRAHTFPMAMLTWLANLGCSTRPTVAPIRSLQELSDNMTFKFTSGKIMLNIEKLARFQNQYSQKILFDPHAGYLGEREERLVYDNLVAPLLKEIDNMTVGIIHHNIAKNLQSAWRQTSRFTPVDALLKVSADGPPAGASNDDTLAPRGKIPPVAPRLEKTFNPDLPWEVPDFVDGPEVDVVDQKKLPKLDRQVATRLSEVVVETPQLTKKKMRTARRAERLVQDEPSEAPSSEQVPFEPGRNILPAKRRSPFTLPDTHPDDFDPRCDYVIRALTARTGEIVQPDYMISHHAYLFFRLPPMAYPAIPYEDLFHAEPYLAVIDEVLVRHPDIWTSSTTGPRARAKGGVESGTVEDTEPTSPTESRLPTKAPGTLPGETDLRRPTPREVQPIDKIQELLLAHPTFSDYDPSRLHAAIRLLLCGSVKTKSMPSGIMFQILGREEVLRRMNELKDYLLSLEKEGDPEGGRAEWWFEQEEAGEGREEREAW